MSDTLPFLPEKPVVLDWPERKTDGFWDWDRHDPKSVVKLVLGQKPTAEDAPRLELTAAEAAELPARLSRFPNLTQVYLWNVDGLKSLDPLPPGLRCLDVRGCRDLESLPGLPSGLETLDTGGCRSLRDLEPTRLTRLKYLYLDRCDALGRDELIAFLKALQKADAPLEEFDASETPGMTSTASLPGRRLRKIVLRKCPNLDTVTSVEGFAALDHLDLRECPGLRELPGLPAGIRHVFLHGSERLTRYLDQDLGVYDRGASAGENVAPILHSRRKFGRELAAAPHAKLLLVGDGRVGKSTLAKRLQWNLLTPEERARHPELEPRLDESPTHKVRTWAWLAPITLPDARVQDLEARARARKVELPRDQQGDLTGNVRIWDFGGQEIYHNTHRIFAAEGSVFLIVWREQPPDWETILAEKPEDVTELEWREWNRQRSLDYWLDYVRSLRAGSRAGAKVALVCTGTPRNARRAPWQERAPRNAHHPGIECFHIDSLEPGCGDNPEYRRLTAWIAAQCGVEADRIGILQPRFFGEVAGELDAMLAENDRCRAEERTAPHLLLDWEAWSRRIVEAHQRRGSGIELEPADIATITGYLHDAGRLFRIERGGRRAVLVDQDWATDHIYSMLKPGSALCKRIQFNRGWLPKTELEIAPDWKTLPDDLSRDRLLEYLEECHVLVRVLEKEESALRDTIFVANEKWLLPRDEEVAPRVERILGLLRSRPGLEVRETFEFESASVSEFEFRDLMARVGRAFGRRGIWFRSGLLALEDPQGGDSDWGLRIAWRPDGPDSFSGRLDALLITRRDLMEDHVRWVEDLLCGTGSPLERYGRPTRRAATDEDLSRATLVPRGRGPVEVGISSSGADEALARTLNEALKAAGVTTVWYKDPECRVSNNDRLQKFLQELGRSRCIVLLLSDPYLRLDLERNWYCPWELADAINRLKRGERALEATFVAYVPGQAINEMNLDRTLVPLFEKMAGGFAEMYRSQPPRHARTFRYLNDFSIHYYDALETSAMEHFCENRGTRGKFSPVSQRADGTWDVTTLVEEIRAYLRGPGRG